MLHELRKKQSQHIRRAHKKTRNVNDEAGSVNFTSILKLAETEGFEPSIQVLARMLP